MRAILERWQVNASPVAAREAARNLVRVQHDAERSFGSAESELADLRKALAGLSRDAASGTTRTVKK